MLDDEENIRRAERVACVGEKQHDAAGRIAAAGCGRAALAAIRRAWCASDGSSVPLRRIIIAGMANDSEGDALLCGKLDC